MMNAVVLVFGGMIALGGATLLIRPGRIFSIFKEYADSVWLYPFAIAIRLVLGAVLLMAAPESKFPLVFHILAWLSWAAALALGVIGRARFRALLGWVLETGPVMQHFMAAFAVVLGSFLAYAVF